MNRTTRHGTLTPNVVASVALGLDADRIEVANRAEEGTVWFTIDGSTPEPNGNGVEIVPSGTALEVRRVAAGNVTVKLLSTLPVDYSIAGETK